MLPAATSALKPIEQFVFKKKLKTTWLLLFLQQMLIDFSHVAFFIPSNWHLTALNPPHLVKLITHHHLSPSICHINFNVISIDFTCLFQKQLTRFWILDGIFSCTDNAADRNYVLKSIYNNKIVTNNTISRVKLWWRENYGMQRYFLNWCFGMA